MLPCKVDWVLGIERYRKNETCEVVGMRLGYDKQGNPPNVLLVARATTDCSINLITVPLPLLFCSCPKVNESVEQFLQHNKVFRSRRLVNRNDLDACVCKRLLQSAMEIW